MARDVSLIEVQKYGKACPPSQSRLPLCIVSRKLFRNCFFIVIVHFQNYCILVLNIVNRVL